MNSVHRKVGIIWVKDSINAWFSGCATLTFASRTDSKTSPYGLIADPFYLIHSHHFEQHQLRQVFGAQPTMNLKLITN
jgi:hypothetical protein